MRDLIKKIFGCFIVLFVLLTNILVAQTESKVLARAGNIDITAEEFADRYTLMPFFTDQKEDQDSLKRKVLYSLIAEKLWAQNAIDQKIDTSLTFRFSVESLKELLLKDELYKNIVIENIKIPGEEISSALLKFNELLKIEMYASKDSAALASFYQKLTHLPQGETNYVDIPADIIKQNKEVTFGDFENEELENAVFYLSENQLTKPVKTSNGWIFVKLIERQANPKTQNENPNSIRDIVYKIIYDRKAFRINSNFLNELLGGIRVNVDLNLFEMLCVKIFDVLNKAYETETNSNPGEFYLDENMFTRLIGLIEKHDGYKTFVKLENNNKTLFQFLFYLSHQKFQVDSLAINSVKSVMHLNVRSFIEQSILTKIAYEKGLSDSKAILRDIKMWTENYMAQQSMRSVGDSISISEKELIEYYKARYNIIANTPQLNILEILNSDLSVIENLLNRIENGEDFRELAKNYSQRNATKINGGEWGFFPAGEGGAVGTAAVDLNIGEVYGPVKSSEGYSIIKLIDKRESPDTTSISYNSMKDFLSVQLRLKKTDNILNRYTSQLAQEKTIRINESVYNSIETNPIKMFTVRYLGFGGKIAALPLVIPNFEWYRLFKNSGIMP